MLDNSGQSTQWRFKPNTDQAFAARFSFAGEAGSAEEDAFLWSMADLMTVLLVFFVLLYSNAITDTDTTSQESNQDIKPVAALSVPVTPPDHFTETTAPATTESLQTEETLAPAPEPPAANLPLPEKQIPVDPMNQEILDGLKDGFSKDFYVRWDEKQPVFVLGERITFNIGDAVLLKDSQSALKRIADLITSKGHYQIIVSGHTDDVAIHTPKFPSNWELSAARAASVARFLTAHGVAPNQVVIQGKSEFHPLVANTSDTNRRANRRVEISLLKGGRDDRTDLARTYSKLQ